MAGSGDIRNVYDVCNARGTRIRGSRSIKGLSPMKNNVDQEEVNLPSVSVSAGEGDGVDVNSRGNYFTQMSQTDTPLILESFTEKVCPFWKKSKNETIAKYLQMLVGIIFYIIFTHIEDAALMKMLKTRSLKFVIQLGLSQELVILLFAYLMSFSIVGVVVWKIILAAIRCGLRVTFPWYESWKNWINENHSQFNGVNGACLSVFGVWCADTAASVWLLLMRNGQCMRRNASTSMCDHIIFKNIMYFERKFCVSTACSQVMFKIPLIALSTCFIFLAGMILFHTKTASKRYSNVIHHGENLLPESENMPISDNDCTTDSGSE